MRISLEQANEIVAKHTKIFETMILPLEQCLDGILAEDVIAIMNQPPFRRSAMDGYAVRGEDIQHCLDLKTLSFQVIGEIDAGDETIYHIGSKEAVRIMTGARVPDNADFVVPQEQSDMGENYVTFSSIPSINNIAPVGEDFKAGEIIAKKGQKVDAYLLACAAACGIKEMRICQRPRIAIISTGDELCLPDEPLKPSKIYDSNIVYLSSRLRQFHCNISSAEHIGDNLENIMEGIVRAVSTADMVITTGGVSVGKKDFLEQAVSNLHGAILFHGIDIKPGMPTMFSLVHDVPVLSLSGNPYSASAIFEWLFPFRSNIYIEACLKRDYKKKRPCPRIVRGIYDGFSVEAVPKQQNGVMQSGIGTNCLALFPAGEEILTAKSRVKLILL